MSYNWLSNLLTTASRHGNIDPVKKPPVCAGELVTTAKRVHPFPSRTQQLSSSALTILWGQPHGKIRRRRLTRSHGRFFYSFKRLAKSGLREFACVREAHAGRQTHA